jgi:glycosyltransferase involved in cell wall biosynthesis
VDGWTGRWLTDAFVAVSAFVRDSAVRNLGLPAARVEVIPNSVELSRFAPSDPAQLAALRRELGIGAADRVITTVGRLDPPKGHRFLLEALVEVRRRVPGVRLLIVGDGPSRANLEVQACEHGVSDRVVFAGVRGDIPAILGLSEVFVLPTLSEGLPLTVLEAMAAGVPPVASRIGPTEEIVESGHTGVLVEPREPKPLAEAITRLLLAPAEARAIGARARAQVEARFSARRCAEALGALYVKLSDRRRG